MKIRCWYEGHKWRYTGHTNGYGTYWHKCQRCGKEAKLDSVYNW